MNKSTILANINGFITAVITQLKVRNSLLELVNNLWSPTVNDVKITSSLTPLTVTTPLQANIHYDIVFSRTGNKVWVQGRVWNNSATPIALFTDICNITDVNYQAKALLALFVATDPFTNTIILLNFSNKITCATSMPAFGSFWFNGVYFTND